jgi:glycosyltransferase involved in cell wall biosynthesis
VPPRFYGGTERVVSTLTEELVHRGHDVTLFAATGSRTEARLRPLRPPPPWQLGGMNTLLYHVLELFETIASSGEFDIIHSHLEYLPWLVSDRLKPPLVTTLHSLLDRPELRSILRANASQPLVAISERQRRPVTDLDLNWQGTIHHGLRLREDYELGLGEGGYLVFLGRISAEKDPVAAIEIAVRSGLPIKVAAMLPPEERPYFDASVRPLLEHPLVEWIGEQDDQSKNQLLGDAIALLAPSAWEEPFGLNFIEALACGTPVVARPRGAVAEILNHGEHGLLGETEDELVEACQMVGQLDRQACREWALERYSVQRMVDDYERIYQRVIEQASEPQEGVAGYPTARLELTGG